MHAPIFGGIVYKAHTAYSNYFVFVTGIMRYRDTTVDVTKAIQYYHRNRINQRCLYKSNGDAIVMQRYHIAPVTKTK